MKWTNLEVLSAKCRQKSGQNFNECSFERSSAFVCPNDRIPAVNEKTTSSSCGLWNFNLIKVINLSINYL